MQSLQLAPFLSGEITNINSSIFFETMNDENIWVCLVLVIIFSDFDLLIIYPSFSDMF